MTVTRSARIDREYTNELSTAGTILAELYEAPAEALLQRVVDCAVELIDCDASATALLRDRREVEEAAFTSERSKRAALLQLELDGGPCLTAMANGGVIRVDDTHTDSRWPRWCAAVADLGVRSSVSVSVTSGDARSLGSLFVYSGRADAFDDEDVAAIRILAAHAAIAVRHSRRQSLAERVVDTRTQIGQAEGILIAAAGVTADEAFALLVDCAQVTQRKLRDIAAEVVATHRLPGRDCNVAAV
jgi:GAF domain-containing protein